MQQSDIIKFVKNILLLVILIAICDQLLGYGLQSLYFSLKKGQYAQTTYSIDSTSQDVVIFGSSRALHHYASTLLSEELNQSVYNAGRDGQFVPYYCALQDAVLKRKKPEVIILDVNVWEMAPNNEKYEKLSMLLPYFPKHPEIQKYVKEISAWETVKLLSRTYPYNSTLFVSIHNYLFAEKLPVDDFGYFPLERTMSKADFENYSVKKKIYDAKRAKQQIPLDEKAVQYYEYFLHQADSLGIKTYVIISPTLLREPATREKLLLEEVAKKYKNVAFLDYTSSPAFNDQYTKFSDEFHLNGTGAVEFTKLLVSEIRDDLAAPTLASNTLQTNSVSSTGK
jgi:hypothetical protein